MVANNQPSEAVEISSNEFHTVKPIKRRAIEVELSDGQLVYVFEPKTADMGTFSRALPALQSVAKAFQVSNETADGVMGMSVNIPDSAYEGLFPLIAVMSNITVDEYKALPLFDGIALLRALTVFAPKNAQAATPSKD